MWYECKKKVISSREQIADKFSFNNNCPMREYNRKLCIVRTGGSFSKAVKKLNEKKKFTIESFRSMSMRLNGRLELFLL